MNYDPYKQFSATEMRDLALKTKAEIKRAENLKGYLVSFYSENDYIMVAIKEYLERLAATQYAISRHI